MKFISLVLILVLLFCGVAYADTAPKVDKFGGYFLYNTEVTQEAVPEVVEYSAVLKDLTFAEGTAEALFTVDTVIDKLDYTIKITHKNNTVVAEDSGKLDSVEGDQIINITWVGFDGTNKGASITFTVSKTVITEAIPEKTTKFTIGYEYPGNCKVLFRQKLTIKDMSKLKSKRPFKPFTDMKWCTKFWATTWLYKVEDWKKLDNDTITPTVTPTITPTNSTVITTGEYPEESMIQYDEDTMLPKTGETEPYKYIIVGGLLIILGIMCYMGYRKFVCLK